MNNIAPQMPGLAAANRSKMVLDFVTEALRSGDQAEAQRLLRQHLLEYPNDPAALTKLAAIAIDDQRFEEATVLLRRAADSQRTPAAYAALLQHLQQHCGPDAVLKEVAALPPVMRNGFDALAAEAAALGILGIHDRQIAIYERMGQAWPDNPTLWKTLGDAYKTVGRFDDAVAALRKAIEVCPSYGEAWWTLSNFKSFRFSDEDIRAMRRIVKKKLSDVDALHFHFALGKAFEDRNQYGSSFRHYASANQLRAASFSRDQMSVTRFVDLAIATFSADFFAARAGWGTAEEGPIFVLGLHRSGSTLVEQILATHPLIEGTTEITVMQQLWDRLSRIGARRGRGAFEQIAELTVDEARALGQEYLDRTRPFRLTDKPFFVDKLPANWMALGLIRMALPNARIIDARRHPMACGFSNFKQNYASGVAFSYSLETVGAFYRDYWRFMQHFDAVQPGVAHRVINERLIEDPEGEVRRLLDHIGVDFDPLCLDFHRNKRAVRTPSAEQVRRPINRDGVDYWRHYEAWLNPLKQALGPALDHWDR